jgi:Asp-tRNA(Asn)/Glu-tRNA(Gln) amidotransferase A subunit family amidase
MTLPPRFPPPNHACQAAGDLPPSAAAPAPAAPSLDRRGGLATSTWQLQEQLPYSAPSLDRRGWLATLAALGIGGAAFQRALAWQAEQAGRITPDMIQQAEWIAGITLTEQERSDVARAVDRDQRRLAALRAVALPSDVPPATLFFASLPHHDAPRGLCRVQPRPAGPSRRPEHDDDLAFLPVSRLASLLRTRQISSVELTRLYLQRLQRYDPLLHCVVTLTEALALAEAEQADREIRAGQLRGPLHGIPWGAKDILAWPGYPTTWGAAHFQTQRLEVQATAARRLREAGAVLVGKLSVGALALGADWFGGTTRNPWNPQEPSSGSSAGSAAAVVAGLVGFALGTETLGSIVSPCRRCSATGLRPTFGRVSRHGAMTLAWSMDKIGPIARCVEDCALVLGAIHGSDGQDPTAVDRPFVWPPRRSAQELRVGFFEGDRPPEEQDACRVLRELGVRLVPIRLPDDLPVEPLTVILDTEAAAAFDDLTRQGVREGIGRWATTFRKGQFVPAVAYLRAQRVRTLWMQRMDELMRQVDAYVGGDDLVVTNFTGHPTVVVPTGNRKDSPSGQPSTITFTGRLFGEEDLLALAWAFEQAAGAVGRRPPLPEMPPAENASKSVQ